MAMFAIGAAIATTQIMAGQAAKAEGDYNASLFEQQAGTINIIKDIEEKRAKTAKGIEATQYRRIKGQLVATTMARAAGAGLDFGGSPIAVLIDTLTQVGIDEAIGRYNIDIGIASRIHELETQKIYALSSASEARRRGRLARNTYYSNAFSTLMMGAYQSGSRVSTGGAAGRFGSASPPRLGLPTYTMMLQ